MIGKPKFHHAFTQSPNHKSDLPLCEPLVFCLSPCGTCTRHVPSVRYAPLPAFRTPWLRLFVRSSHLTGFRKPVRCRVHFPAVLPPVVFGVWGGWVVGVEPWIWRGATARDGGWFVGEGVFYFSLPIGDGKLEYQPSDGRSL